MLSLVRSAVVVEVDRVLSLVARPAAYLFLDFRSRLLDEINSQMGQTRVEEQFNDTFTGLHSTSLLYIRYQSSPVLYYLRARVWPEMFSTATVRHSVLCA
jgi:hypothetical protein